MSVQRADQHFIKSAAFLKCRELAKRTKRIDDSVSVPTGGEAVVGASTDVWAKKPAKASGELKRVAPSFD